MSYNKYGIIVDGEAKKDRGASAHHPAREHQDAAVECCGSHRGRDADTEASAGPTAVDAGFASDAEDWDALCGTADYG